MKSFSAGTAIDASPETVWSVLVDTPRWPDFDPFCERIEGNVVLGGTIKAFTKLAPGRAFPVKVAVLERPRLMVWRGGMPLGLFLGVRTFAITPEGAGCRFEMREEFSGPMLGLIAGSLPDMTEPFAAFCAGLKATAEASASRSET